VTAVPVGSTVLLLAGFLLVNEVVARQWRPPAELSRKLAHVGSALLAAVSCLWLDHRWYVIIGLAFTAALLLARRFLPLRSLRSRSERSWGELLFGIGVAIAALIADGTASFVQAVLILGLADTAAYLVGRRRPVLPLLLGRTVGGSVAFLITTFLIALPAGPGPAAVVAISCTLAELVSPRGTDNLTVPALAAVLISALA
jgi:dolichol kinase